MRNVLVTSAMIGMTAVALLLISDLDLAFLIPEENRDKYCIAGWVRDAAGKPIAGAKVNAFTNSPHDGMAVTGPDGWFQIPELGADTYVLWVSHEGYTPKKQDMVERGQVNLTFTLDRLPSIKGRVFEAATGRPVTAFQVRYTSSMRTDWPPYWDYGFVSVNDRQGAFELENIKPGRGVLHIKAPGFASRGYPLEPLQANQSLDNVRITLEPAALVHGRVMSPDGAPLEGALVFIEPWQTMYIEPDKAVAWSGANGEFSIDHLAKAPPHIWVYHENYAPVTASPRVSEGAAHYAVTMAPGGAIRGRVSRASLERLPQLAGYGNPANLLIEMYLAPVSPPGSTPIFHRLRARVDAEGRYHFSNVPPGEAKIQMVVWARRPALSTPRGMDYEERQFSVLELSQSTAAAAGEERELNFDLPLSQRALEGQITLGPGRYGPPDIQYWNDAGGTSLYSRLTIDGGMFRIENLLDGPVAVLATIETRLSRQYKFLEFAQLPEHESRISFDFTQGGALRVYATDNDVPDGVDVSVVQGDETVLRQNRPYPLIGQARLDTGRRAHFTGLPPGTYCILVHSWRFYADRPAAGPEPEQFNSDRPESHIPMWRPQRYGGIRGVFIAEIKGDEVLDAPIEVFRLLSEGTPTIARLQATPAPQ